MLIVDRGSKILLYSLYSGEVINKDIYHVQVVNVLIVYKTTHAHVQVNRKEAVHSSQSRIDVDGNKVDYDVLPLKVKDRSTNIVVAV